jgi:hypothetical protein
MARLITTEHHMQKPPPIGKTWLDGVPWIDIEDLAPAEPRTRIEDVPRPLQQKLRECWLRGVPEAELARIFQLPIEWMPLLIADDSNPN